MAVTERKSSLAKLAAVFAVGFLISLGLCGVNFVAVMSGHAVLPNLLFITAWIELAGMGVCLIGLVFVGLISISDAVSRRFAARQNPPEDKQ